MRRVLNFKHTRTLQKILARIYNLLPGQRPRQQQLDELFLTATSVQIIEPRAEAILKIFCGPDIQELKSLIEIEEGLVPLDCKASVELKISLFAQETRIAEFNYYVGAISYKGWNCRAVLAKDGEFVEWLESRGIILPCCQLPPDWDSVLRQLRSGTNIDDVKLPQSVTQSEPD